jgi:hypothetical protein
MLMAAFAVTLRNSGLNPAGILMLLDEPRDADEIAFELRRKGQDVVVREVSLTFAAGTAPPFGPAPST